MYPVPTILLIALFAAPACAEQVPTPNPNPPVGTSPEAFPNDAAWRREHLQEFIKADRNSDGMLTREEFTEFNTLVEAQRLKTVTSPSPGIATDSPTTGLPNPSPTAPVVPQPVPNQPLIPPVIPAPDPQSPDGKQPPQPVPRVPPMDTPTPAPVTPAPEQPKQ